LLDSLLQETKCLSFKETVIMYHELGFLSLALKISSRQEVGEL